MNQILFSSWGGQIVDNRGKDPKDYDPVDHVDLPEYFKQDESIKALMGWDGIILRTEDIDILDYLREYTEAVLGHSKTCDKCNYCRTGWEEQLEVLEDLFNGEATEDDLEFLESTSDAIQDAGKCSIGKLGPTPMIHVLKYFKEDLNQALNGSRSGKPASYLSKVTAPCTDACPIHLDIPKYVELIKDAKFTESLEVIRDRLPLPGVLGRACYHPCESACRRANVDESISIRLLKRFVSDQALDKNEELKKEQTPSEKSGKVAIVGAGPAGLTCAYHLALKGHQVTIFEKQPVYGGMMSLGIPEYRLPRDIIKGEVDVILNMGVEMKNNVEVGKDVTVEQLRKEGYNAIFLAIGAHECKSLGVEGEDQEGVYPGVDFLREIGLGNKVELGDRVAVIGGGNVAIDAVRTARRLGAAEPFIIYRRGRDEMPAHQQEIEECQEEGIEIHTLATPVKIIGDGGRVKAVECVKMALGEPDESGRRRPVPQEGSEFSVELDNLIPALGQESDWACLGSECACTLSDWGTVNADRYTKQTDDADIFAGGDAVTGPESLVEATASGKKAAMSIDKFINGQSPEMDDEDAFDDLFKSIKLYDPDEEVKKVEPLERKKPSVLPPETRATNFDEVEAGFATPDAVAEAERCLRCYRAVTLAY